MDSFSLITELKDLNSRQSNLVNCQNGVTGLSYTTECGGNLLSTGFQAYISVYSPDSSLSKSYVGKLEGHSGIVITCKAFPGTPHCVSIDDKFNVRIWDLRSFMTI
jgi:WD40 repeat protein